MFVTQNQSNEIITIIYVHQNILNSLRSIKEERMGEAYRFSFPSTVEPTLIDRPKISTSTTYT
jgi:hypothetical protein